MKHEVFLSFRGEEIRRTFLSHLLSSLKKKDITTSTASESSPESFLAIQASLVAIPVISKNKASLNLWVDDLAKMIECEEKKSLTAVPIFFQFESCDDISKMLRNAERDAQSMQGIQRETMKTVKKWLDSHVTKKSGFLSYDCKHDSELVGKVTSFVSDILTSSRSSHLPSSGLVPPARSLKLSDAFRLDPTVKKVEPSRDGYKFISSRVESLRATVLRAESILTGVCGIQGVGKTSLVRHVYDEISPNFQYRFWIRPRDISCCRPNSLVNDLASSFHGRSNDAITKEMIRHRKVLLVADDVDDIKKLKGIIKDSSWFGPGSRVIVITQDKSLLTQCGVKYIFELECLNYEEALAFFSEFAFKQKNPLPGFEDLSFLAVQVSNRLPLALELLGSFLCNKEKDEWERTLRKLQDSHNNYATEVCRYIGAEEYAAPRRPMKVDQHIEAKRLPFYRFALN